MLVPGWPVKVLLVHLVCLYFFSGIYKLLSPAWQTGYMMYFVNKDLAWSLLPNVTGALPVMLDRLATRIGNEENSLYPHAERLRQRRAA